MFGSIYAKTYLRWKLARRAKKLHYFHFTLQIIPLSIWFPFHCRQWAFLTINHVMYVLGYSLGRKLADGQLCTKKTQVTTLAQEEETDMVLECSLASVSLQKTEKSKRSIYVKGHSRVDQKVNLILMHSGVRTKTQDLSLSYNLASWSWCTFPEEANVHLIRATLHFCHTSANTFLEWKITMLSKAKSFYTQQKTLSWKFTGQFGKWSSKLVGRFCKRWNGPLRCEE